jgi:hypothetical protein
LKGITITLKVRRFLEAKITTRDDGRRVRVYLNENWARAEGIIVDFENMQVASVSFFDEAFGLLAEEHSALEIKKKVYLTGMDDQDQVLYESIMKSRLAQFKSKKKTTSVD